MIFHRFFYPYLAIFSYLVGDEITKKCIIIDPTRNIEEYLKAAQNEQLTITDIIETHVHADYVSGAQELKSALKGKPVIHSSAMGGEKWIPSYADQAVKEGDEIVLGNVRLVARHAPGHSPEHLIWIGFDKETSREIPCFVFTGDLLFAGGIGRPDILGEETFLLHSQQLYKSLFETIADLPDFISIFPGHGRGSSCGNAVSRRPFSTLGYERKTNENFFPRPFEQWKEALLQQMPKIPPSFDRIKHLNLKGASVLHGTFPKELKDVPTDERIFLIDIRAKETFAKGHPKNAINIPWGDSFCLWASWIVPANMPLAIIYEDMDSLKKSVEGLRLIGLDTIEGVVKYLPGVSDLSFQMISVDSLSKLMGTADTLTTIVDVRTPAEWENGHIPGAYHVELENLKKESVRIPKEGMVAVICRSGYRASIGASLLEKEGFLKVSNVQGGMQAWTDARLPVDKE